MNDNKNEVQIVAYKPQYKEAFKALNEEWIKAFFIMEASDYKLLDNPEEYILNKGGHIIFALLNGEVAGTCALVKTDDNPLTFELSKMAVSPKAQGKKLGYLLGNTLIEKAKELNAEKLYLVTNSILVPAIKLYEKLGFMHTSVSNAEYDRADVQMEMILNK
ncbi:GNAT family N-acetyltransferase [Chryseobacterium bernardetii]|uniref:GNAT family N-acetyltransferase n=1 Tax=Chryseobacterium bernardetii TaxID=1241978 RepID=A0A3G6T3X6_9FLAO|nr:GNAT family N-acetyltransferase [Chryseobacterium bernardetii]AZB24062.1 GNAT family N-acetyltransferase [Chryseobacterium bernardetii]